MHCPDTNRLIEHVLEAQDDPELSDHIENCGDCAAELRLLQVLPEAFSPAIEVPEAMVQRVMAGLATTPTTAHQSLPWLQLIISGFLGMLTTLVTIVASGSLGTADPADLLAYCLAVGSAVALSQGRSAVLQNRQSTHPTRSI